MVLNHRMYYIITICYMGFSEQNHGTFTSRAKKKRIDPSIIRPSNSAAKDTSNVRSLAVDDSHHVIMLINGLVLLGKS